MPPERAERQAATVGPPEGSPIYQREKYGPVKGRLLTELEIFGWDLFLEAYAPAYRPQRNDDLFEIAVLARGMVEWFVDEEIHELREGDILIVPPGKLHGSVGKVMQASEHFWMRFRLAPGAAFGGFGLNDADRLRQRFLNPPRRSFAGTAAILDCCRRLLREHRERGDLAEIVARSALHELLASIYRKSAEPKTNAATSAAENTIRTPRSKSIRKAVQQIEQESGGTISVAAVARSVGLPERRFRELFHQETGVTPKEYLIRRRINEAKRLLREGRSSITQIGHAVGFSSSQHFATTFKRLMGMTPRDYVRRIGEAPQDET